MKQVILKKSLSFSDNEITAVKGRPITVNDDKAKELVDSGFFIYCENNAASADSEETGSSGEVSGAEGVDKLEAEVIETISSADNPAPESGNKDTFVEEATKTVVKTAKKKKAKLSDS